MRARSFTARLVNGRKRPYTSWTFVVVPPELASAWGPGQKPVRGTLAGHPFRGTASRGEGVVRIPIPRELRERAGVVSGRAFEVTLELDPAPRPVAVPDELRAVLEANPSVARLFDALPPSHRRAWTAYVGDAKQAETRQRRARSALDGIRARCFPR